MCTLLDLICNIDGGVCIRERRSLDDMQSRYQPGQNTQDGAEDHEDDDYDDYARFFCTFCVLCG